MIERAERLAREEQRAQGALDALKQECRQRYGTDDPNKLQKLLDREKKELAKADKELQELAQEAESSYGHKLRGAG